MTKSDILVRGWPARVHRMPGWAGAAGLLDFARQQGAARLLLQQEDGRRRGGGERERQRGGAAQQGHVHSPATEHG